jgi:hypothetical protein
MRTWSTSLSCGSTPEVRRSAGVWVRGRTHTFSSLALVKMHSFACSDSLRDPSEAGIR